MDTRKIEKRAKKFSACLLIGAMLGATGVSLSGCAQSSSPVAKTTAMKSFEHDDKSQRIATVTNGEISYLKNQGNLLAIQADKHIQHINATQHQRYPIPYTRSADGNYWSWFEKHYIPKSIIKEEMLDHASDAPSSISDSDAQASYDATRATDEIQTSLRNHGINYGVNFNLLGGTITEGLDAYNSYSINPKLPVKLYTPNSAHQHWANKIELHYLETTGDAKAKEADQKIEALNKKHYQKYPIKYTKSPDGHYWSWYEYHSIPDKIIHKFYKLEQHHDNDYNMSSDAGYISTRFDNDIETNLMYHDVDYGTNFNSLSGKIANKYNHWEQS